jgi:uncharacterized membrane protein
MFLLVSGLLLFLGVHAIRIVADGWRSATIARVGLGAWKGLFSLASAAGLVLVIWGYGLTRADPVLLWSPPLWTRHITTLLMIPAFILIAAAYVPRNRVKAALGHPMVLGVKTWALAHLLSNGRLGDVVLFGAFLAWAIADFAAARRRDRAAGTQYPAATLAGDAGAIGAGLAAWTGFAFYLHLALIGVPPFG